MEMRLNQLSEFENIIRSGARMSDPALPGSTDVPAIHPVAHSGYRHQANLKDWDREIIGLRDQQHPS